MQSIIHRFLKGELSALDYRICRDKRNLIRLEYPMDGGVGLALICSTAILLYGGGTMLLIHDFAEAWFPAMLAALFGVGFLTLLIRTRRIHRRLRWLFTGRCPDCGYDLTANASGTCPECGEPIEKPSDTVSK